MRVTVVASISLLGLWSLTACAPSYYEYEETERYREQESRAYFKEEERLAQRKARAKMRAEARARARAKARQERARELARKEASTNDVTDDVEPQRELQREPQQSKFETARKEPVAVAPAKPLPPPVAPESAVEAAATKPVETATAKSADQGDQAAAREASKKQIEDGYRLLRAGFVKKARERFERAMVTNAVEASLAQGRSMDPSYLKTVAFPDVIPDAEQARRMYRRAILLGNTEAKSDLDRLERAMASVAPETQSPSSPVTGEPADKEPVRQQ